MFDRDGSEIHVGDWLVFYGEAATPAALRLNVFALYPEIGRIGVGIGADDAERITVAPAAVRLCLPEELPAHVQAARARPPTVW